MKKKYSLLEIEEGLENIYRDLLNHEEAAVQLGERVHPRFRLSALNLYRYLLVRQHDLRGFHTTLSEYGLSGIRTSEGYIYRNIVNVLKLLKMMRGVTWEPDPGVVSIGYRKSLKLLRKHTRNLFGKRQNNRHTRIMVTLPSDTAEDAFLIKELIASGMEIARINLSHDSPEEWHKMVRHLRSAADELGKPIKIFMDISGPKIRTGTIELHGKKKKPRNYLRLFEGDLLKLVAEGEIGKPAQTDLTGITQPAVVPITTPEVIRDLKEGDRVFFDDGKIQSVVIQKTYEEVIVQITNFKAKGHKLKMEKGVNFPDSELHLKALTEKDLKDLAFACEHADMIGYSFVRKVEDLEALQEEMLKYNRTPGIVLKIENKTAFNNLPLLLLKAMHFPETGVMIARGDLMVEIGEERIAEVQDQILWLCEASHIPVIWATQVFESLAKKGIASRAEITDAAKSTRAECVMLNKGEYILDAVAKLSNIIRRMEKHTIKKKSKMRALNVAKDTVAIIPDLFFKESSPELINV